MQKSKWIQRCDCLRATPLETILFNEGAKQDIHDKNKWHTTRGPVSITGSRFFNWQCTCGGGGAIDLVMHLKDCDFFSAVAHLLATCTVLQPESNKLSNHYSGPPRQTNGCKKLLLPVKKTDAIKRVGAYLVTERKLPPCLVYPAIESGNIYADMHANAVFLMRGKHNVIVGAELRGTTHKIWKGLAHGSNKQKGAFHTGSASFKNLSLCESAIDALSYVTLYPDTLAVSTAGANHNVMWIDNFIARGFRISCAFDNDETGNQTADRLIKKYPVIKRHKPQLKDWNDVLKLQ